MILEKSFRVFFCWKGCLPFLAALVVLVCAMEFDLTGFERKVPEEKQVASVTVTGLHTLPYDEAQHGAIIDSVEPETIHAVLALHQVIVDSKNVLEAQDSYYHAEAPGTGGEYYVETGATVRFYVSYMLKNGDTISRDYTVPVRADELNDLLTISGRMNDLINLPQVVEEAYGLSNEKARDIIKMTLSHYYVDSGNGILEQVEVSKDAYEEVFEAVLADLAEGNIGRRYLMNNQERMDNCLVNDLEIVFYRGIRGIDDVQKPGTELVAAVTKETPDEYEDYMITDRVTVTLQTTSRHTIAALKKAGVLEREVELLTQSELERDEVETYEVIRKD